MDLTWLALSVNVLAMLIMAYSAWSIGTQDAGAPQTNSIARCEVKGRAFDIEQRQKIRIEFLTEANCSKEFFS